MSCLFPVYPAYLKGKIVQTNYERPTVDEYVGGRNPDTELLSSLLQQAYAEKMLEQIQGRGIIDQAVLDAAWYRVAERAKELRA